MIPEVRDPGPATPGGNWGSLLAGLRPPYLEAAHWDTVRLKPTSAQPPCAWCQALPRKATRVLGVPIHKLNAPHSRLQLPRKDHLMTVLAGAISGRVGPWDIMTFPGASPTVGAMAGGPVR